MNKSNLAWLKKYNFLKSIYYKNGNCNIKKGEYEQSFYNWVCRQRMDKKDGILKYNREQLLNEINFDFHCSWEDMFAHFTNYLKLYKSIEIPIDNEFYPIIGKWIKKQFKLMKNNRLPQEKVALYNKLGINQLSNKSLDDIWLESYNKLKNFYTENGHCKIPNTDEYKSLYRFVQTQRKNYKNNKLNKSKIELLSSINFCFDLWDSKYLLAKEYYLKHNTLLIPNNDKENLSIRNWVNSTRDNYKKNKLNTTQIEKLCEINFPFEIESCDKSWLNKYYKAKVFYNKNNNYEIDPFISSKELFSWSIEQSILFKKKELSLYKINLLNKISFDFNLDRFSSIDDTWIKQYCRIYYIFNKYQHYYIDYSDKRDLLDWIFEQCLNENNLSSEKKELLEKINFDFKLISILQIEDGWIKKYKLLKKKFKNKNVELKECSYNLFIWIKSQCILYKKGSLSIYKTNLLKDINFTFDFDKYNNINNKWIYFYKKLQRFYIENKNFNINPFVHNEDLFDWTIRQCILKSKNKLDTNKVLLLNEINFTFNTEPLSQEECDWLKYYKKLKSFRKNYGHCIVDNQEHFKKLYRWTNKQKYLKEQGLLRDDFSNYLNRIDFEFSNSWNKMFNRFKIYYDLYESLNIPINKHLQYKEIDIWLKEQLRLFKNNELPCSIVNSYNELGIDLNLYI